MPHRAARILERAVLHEDSRYDRRIRRRVELLVVVDQVGPDKEILHHAGERCAVELLKLPEPAVADDHVARAEALRPVAVVEPFLHKHRRGDAVLPQAVLERHVVAEHQEAAPAAVVVAVLDEDVVGAARPVEHERVRLAEALRQVAVEAQVLVVHHGRYPGREAHRRHVEVAEVEFVPHLGAEVLVAATLRDDGLARARLAQCRKTVVEVRVVVLVHRAPEAYELGPSLRAADVHHVERRGHRAHARSAARRRRIPRRPHGHVHELPVVLRALDVECVAAARVDVHVLKREVTVREHVEAVLADVVVRKAVEPALAKLVAALDRQAVAALAAVVYDLVVALVDVCPVRRRTHHRIEARAVRRQPLHLHAVASLVRAEVAAAPRLGEPRAPAVHQLLGKVGECLDRHVPGIGRMAVVVDEVELPVGSVVTVVEMDVDEAHALGERVDLPVPVDVQVADLQPLVVQETERTVVRRDLDLPVRHVARDARPVEDEARALAVDQQVPRVRDDDALHVVAAVDARRELHAVGADLPRVGDRARHARGVVRVRRRKAEVGGLHDLPAVRTRTVDLEVGAARRKRQRGGLTRRAPVDRLPGKRQERIVPRVLGEDGLRPIASEALRQGLRESRARTRRSHSQHQSFHPGISFSSNLNSPGPSERTTRRSPEGQTRQFVRRPSLPRRPLRRRPSARRRRADRRPPTSATKGSSSRRSLSG